jgi:hypothetical protein
MVRFEHVHMTHLSDTSTVVNFSLVPLSNFGMNYLNAISFI